jgi:hypothetical protein
VALPPPPPQLPDLLFKQFCEFGARSEPCPSMHPAYYTVFLILLWSFYGVIYCFQFNIKICTVYESVITDESLVY